MLFYFLFGRTPFNDVTPELVFERILVGEIDWESYGDFLDRVPPDAIDLIKRLLRSDPKERLGHHNSIDEIKSHSWFRDVDWETVF